jgi:hypothetical protein
MIDCKSLDDYKIFHALFDHYDQALDHITLCSHQQLWQFAHKISPHDKVYVFDTDHWLTSYLQQLQQDVDLLFLINLCDQMYYRFELEKHQEAADICKNLVIQLTIISARLHIHLARYFNTSINSYEL